jgi:hypothetical protein
VASHTSTLSPSTLASWWISVYGAKPTSSPTQIPTSQNYDNTRSYPSSSTNQIPTLSPIIGASNSTSQGNGIINVSEKVAGWGFISNNIDASVAVIFAVAFVLISSVIMIFRKNENSKVNLITACVQEIQNEIEDVSIESYVLGTGSERMGNSKGMFVQESNLENEESFEETTMPNCHLSNNDIYGDFMRSKVVLI